MSSSKIQEYNLDPNCGFAKENTAQEILSQMGQGVTANVVKSVQRGIITIASSSSSGTTTINAVDVNKAVIIPNCVWISDAPSGDTSQRMIEQGKGYFALTNSTTVTLTEGYHTASHIVKGAFTVVEYY